MNVIQNSPLLDEKSVGLPWDVWLEFQIVLNMENQELIFIVWAILYIISWMHARSLYFRKIHPDSHQTICSQQSRELFTWREEDR